MPRKRNQHVATVADSPGFDELREVRRALLGWYELNKRDLPWRRTTDAYAIWVSEVMLQQTRVETVLPYYARFLERFPHVAALAEASLDDVLAMWSGLGYYRRARLLHAGARHVTTRNDGRIPNDLAAIREIPGVGAYTAGAIGSQAFSLQTPVVDGNVARVVARWCAIEVDVKKGAGLARTWRIAGDLVRGERPGALNNALMELGATVCVPHNPRCASCPITGHCQARARGLERSLPIASDKPVRPRVIEAAAILRVRGGDPQQVVVARCAEGGLFSGLWEAPRVSASAAGRPVDEHIARASLEAMLGAAISLGRSPPRRFEHVLTHRLIDVTVWEGEIDRAPHAIGPAHGARYDAVDVVDAATLATRGVSTLARRVLGV